MKHSIMKKESLAQDKTVYYCTKIKDNDYLQIAQFTIKTSYIKNDKLEWLGLGI